jgi:hypothetical protein
VEGLEIALDDSREMSKQSANLHQLPEFRGWLPTRQAVDEMLGKVGETITSGTEPDPNEMQEKVQAELLAATDRYFTPERRAQLVRAMKDSAYSVFQRDGESKALEVVALMNTIENAGLITDPPQEIPFLRGMFEKAISIMLAQGNGSLRIPVARSADADPLPAGAEDTSAPADTPEAAS